MLLFTDRAEIAGLVESPNGFVVASARVARAGNVQDYRGSEVGKPELAKVRVYRPEGSVFDRASAKTATHKPVTLEHPSEFVTSDNWHKAAVGWIGDEIMRDGEFIRVPMTIAARKAIDAIKGGQRELSVGYACDLIWESGTSPAGEAFDAQQSNIVIDHVAIVESGRAGPECRIGDWRSPESVDKSRRSNEDRKMKTIVIDGLSIDVEDMAGSIVTRHVDRLEKQVADAKKGSDEWEIEKKKKKEEMEGKDGQIAALTKQVGDAVLTPEKLDAMVKDRLAVVDKARKILGDKVVVDGKSEADIRRAVVVAKLGDEAAKAMSDAAIQGAFAALTADAVAGDKLARGLSDVQTKPTADAAHADYVKRIGDAWRPKIVA